MKTSIFSIRNGLAFLAILVSTSGAADLWVFDKGMPARAAEVNSNFQEILRRLDTLNRMIREQSALRDSLPVLRGKMRADSAALQAGLRGKIRADSLALSAGVLLPGAVAGFLVAPDEQGYLPNSDDTWVLAAGQGMVNGVAVPDLRGHFLRGIFVPVPGAPGETKNPDPGGARVAGVMQDGMLQSHAHAILTLKEGWTGSQSQPNPPSPLKTGLNKSANGLTLENFATNSDGGGSETRPRNVAVYWYVKVK